MLFSNVLIATVIFCNNIYLYHRDEFVPFFAKDTLFTYCKGSFT